MAKIKKVAKAEKKAKESTTLNLHEFAKSLEVEGVTQGQVSEVLSTYFRAVESTVLGDSLSPGDKITMPGLGQLVCLQKKARNARNPKTGEKLQVPARPAVKFKLAGPLRIWGKPVKEAKPAKKAKKK